MKGAITVQLTNGFGNNIFQYVAAKQLSTFLDSDLYVLPPTPDYYAIPDLAKIGIYCHENVNITDPLLIGDSNYSHAFSDNLRGQDILLSGYFENYKYYFKNLEKIKNWFPKVENRKNNDLIIHLRTGDRLFMKNEFYMKPRVENYLEAIDNFDFKKLYIVTDLPLWKTMTEKELASLRFHRNVPLHDRVPIQESTQFINEFVSGFEKFKPIVHKGSISEDFNFIRSFDNILFEHGTMSWWAAFLSDASRIGVYGPWRPWKKSSNKNLSNIPIETWFKWK